MKISIEEEKRYDVETHKTLFKWSMNHLGKVCSVSFRFDQIHEQDAIDNYRQTIVDTFKIMSQRIEDSENRNNPWRE